MTLASKIAKMIKAKTLHTTEFDFVTVQIVVRARFFVNIVLFFMSKIISAGMVGDGLAIKPSNETVCAPVFGKITVLMEDSKHAVGMTLSNGVEILIHVGIDTVSMGGEGFSYLVKVGDVVKAGTPLLKFSREKIKAAGHPDTAVFVVTNPNGVSFKFNAGQEAKTGKTIIATY